MHFVHYTELLACVLLASNAMVFCLSISVPCIVRLVPQPCAIPMSQNAFQVYVSVFLPHRVIHVISDSWQYSVYVVEIRRLKDTGLQTQLLSNSCLILLHKPTLRSILH